MKAHKKSVLNKSLYKNYFGSYDKVIFFVKTLNFFKKTFILVDFFLQMIIILLLCYTTCFYLFNMIEKGADLMKKISAYKKCPRCELNYIPKDDELCDVCKSELKMIKDKALLSDDEEDILCPICKQNYISIEDDMCLKCAERLGEKKIDTDDVEDDSWEEYAEDTADVDDDIDILSLNELAEKEEQEQDDYDIDDIDDIDDEDDLYNDVDDFDDAFNDEEDDEDYYDDDYDDDDDEDDDF